MSRIDLLVRQTTIDLRHIEKHADEEIYARMREYTEMVVQDVVEVIKNADIPLIEEGGRDEILADIERLYKIEIE